jgi:HlyD family secretion protein
MDQLVTRSKPVAQPRTEDTATVELELARAGGRGRRGRAWIVVVLALLAAAGAAAWYFWADAAPRTVFSTVPAARGDITVEVSATGALQPLTQVDVSSELSGVVRSVFVDENQRVKKGDPLAALDTVRLNAQLERAKASAQAAEAKVAEARTTLKETEQSLARTAELVKRGAVTTQTLETAQATRDRADANVAVAEANLAIADADVKVQEADVQKSTIYAPIDGIVLTRSVNPGQTVASSMQAPVLFVIAADLESMELKAAIDEADIGGVRSGQTARFTVDAFPERTFDAEIGDIAFASVTTEGVVTYNARLEVDNKELLLRPGMTATVAIVIREAKDVLEVPAAAFRYVPPAPGASRSFSLRDLFMPRMPRPGGAQRQRRAGAADQRTLYVLKDGAPQAVQVRIGSTDGEKTEILSGLSEGDRVIVGARQASE